MLAILCGSLSFSEGLFFPHSSPSSFPKVLSEPELPVGWEEQIYIWFPRASLVVADRLLGKRQQFWVEYQLIPFYKGVRLADIVAMSPCIQLQCMLLADLS